MTKYRNCRTCGRAKRVGGKRSEFYRKSSDREGYSRECKDCEQMTKQEQRERAKHAPINNALKKWGRC